MFVPFGSRSLGTYHCISLRSLILDEYVCVSVSVYYECVCMFAYMCVHMCEYVCLVRVCSVCVSMCICMYVCVGVHSRVCIISTWVSVCA